MAAESKYVQSRLITDKKALQGLMDEIDVQAGIAHDPTATAQKARAMMRAQGVRAEANNASRELMQIRYGDDWEKG